MGDFGCYAARPIAKSYCRCDGILLFCIERSTAYRPILAKTIFQPPLPVKFNFVALSMRGLVNQMKYSFYAN